MCQQSDLTHPLVLYDNHLKRQHLNSYLESMNTIKTWNEDDRPREKMLNKGVAALSDAELISILIGSGTREMSAVELARKILHYSGNNLDNLGRIDAKDLAAAIKGIGPAKAVSICAAMEIGRRRNRIVAENTTTIQTSMTAARIIRPILADLNHEEFWLMLLNNANHCIGKIKISEGGLTGTVADIRVALRHALINNATAIMAFHNHPSGIRRPSTGDIEITEKFKKASATMDIRFLDHIIICGKEEYFSFADEGLL